MKKNKVCLSARQGFAPIAIVLIIVAVLVVGFFYFKTKKNNYIVEPVGQVKNNLLPNDVQQKNQESNGNETGTIQKSGESTEPAQLNPISITGDKPNKLYNFHSDKFGVSFSLAIVGPADRIPFVVEDSNGIYMHEKNKNDADYSLEAIKKAVSCSIFGTCIKFYKIKNPQDALGEMNRKIGVDAENQHCVLVDMGNIDKGFKKGNYLVGDDRLTDIQTKDILSGYGSDALYEGFWPKYPQFNEKTFFSKYCVAPRGYRKIIKFTVDKTFAYQEFYGTQAPDFLAQSNDPNGSYNGLYGWTVTIKFDH